MPLRQVSEAKISVDTKGFNRILFYGKCPCGRGHLQNHEKSDSVTRRRSTQTEAS